MDEASTNIFEPYPGSEIFNTLVQARQGDLDDNYFLLLTSMYSDFTKTDLLTFNEPMSPRELSRWRLAFMLAAYGLGYVRYPSRILRTPRNVCFGSHQAATVLEHRLKDGLRRARVLVKSRRQRQPVPSA